MKLLDIYRENPFYILSASSGTSRKEMIGKQEELALFGNEAKTEHALASLLHPQTRTEAEIRWFPLVKAEEAKAIIEFFERHWEDTQMPGHRMPSVVGQFHLVRLALGRIQIRTVSELKMILHSTALAADTLIPEQVMEEINRDRRQSGFPEIKTRNSIELQIRELFRETIKAYRENAVGRVSGMRLKSLAKEIGKEYKDAFSPYHNSYFLEISTDQLDARSALP